MGDMLGGLNNSLELAQFSGLKSLKSAIFLHKILTGNTLFFSKGFEMTWHMYH